MRRFSMNFKTQTDRGKKSSIRLPMVLNNVQEKNRGEAEGFMTIPKPEIH